MNLLKLALERQNYNLAAHVLVYGLVKAKVELYPKDSANFRVHHNYDDKGKRREVASK